MRVEPFEALPDGAEFDFAVVGSGFGGSVAALRLREKGYSVAVLEAGRHFEDSDFARTNWDLRRYLWAPKLGLRGIQRITWLEHLLALSGAGVGGGSLVYGGVLMEPTRTFLRACRPLGERFEERLGPHLKEASRMLGAAPVPRLADADRALERAAEGLGRRDTFGPTTVGVYFGEPGRSVADPYFGGRGPARAGCVFCGGCMVGCRHGAKNTLAKNYLPLAAARGARLFSGCQVVSLSDRLGGGLLVEASSPGAFGGRKTVRARRLVLAAGTLGTLRLLLEPRNRLGPLPPRLGRDVRTNGEALLGAFACDARQDWSQGVAIGSEVWADEETHVQAARYGAGSGAMALLGWPRGGGPLRRLRALWPFGWSQRALILLAMQTRDSRLRLSLDRRGRLASGLEPDARAPQARLSAAERLQEELCRRAGAVAMTTIFEAWLGIPATAHIIGGACRAPGPETGCVGPDGRLFGRDDVWVLDGSALPANPGVNPSLTIAALAEQAMSLVPPKAAAA